MRPRFINHKITAQICRMSAAEVCRRRRDIVLHIIGGTRSVVLHRLGAVIDLVCARGGKGNVRRIDIRLIDFPRAVAVRRELVIVRTERRAHRRADARILHGFVRARVRVGGKGRIRCTRAVLTGNARQSREIRAADTSGIIP